MRLLLVLSRRVSFLHNMDSLYQEHILEHYKHPHNRRRMEDFDIKQTGENISCGDDLVMYLKITHDANCSRATSSSAVVLPHRAVHDSVHSSHDSLHPIEHSASEVCCNWVLSDVAFEGFGCAISQSGASMLTDKVKGMTKSDIASLSEKDMYDLYGTVISPQREKCALLALATLHEALKTAR
jgi:nitrogen fixation NifU-like protein